MNATDLHAPRKAPYSADELRRTLDPKSIAIIGASPRKGSFSERTLLGLQEFKGNIHLVNERYDEVAGQRCYASVFDLPEVPDIAVVTTPRETVEPIVADCGKAGIGGALIFASGYAETGKAERIALQQKLVAISRETGLRIVGPNCVGFFNFASKLALSFTSLGDMPPSAPHAIGLASQSGALAVALAQAKHLGVSFSHALTAGNSCDIDIADLVSFLATEPTCRSIACLFEGMRDPMRIIRAAELARANGKPVIALKIGSSPEGSAAALSHTGSLAGSDQAYTAAFRQAGIIRVDHFDELVQTAAFFAKAPPPATRGVAVASTSGGASVMAADDAYNHGIELPQPLPPAQAILNARIPEFGSARNPCDVTAQVVNDPESLRETSDALLADASFSALISPVASANPTNSEWRVQMLGELAAKHGKIACLVWLSGWLGGPGAEAAERNPHVAVFASMNSCFRTLRRWHDYYDGVGKTQPAPGISPLAKPAATLIASAPANVLTEREAKAVLKQYGIRVVEEHLVRSADEAVATAKIAGYPLAMKVESPDIAHKTEAGVIALNIRDEQQLRQEYKRISDAGLRAASADRINGVLVQPMIPPGVEILLGAKNDPLFGPLVVVGFGGVFVELLKDAAVRLAPVTSDEAKAMLKELRGHALLNGFRGSEPVNIDKLSDTIAKFSQLVFDQAAVVEEIDVNPVICAGDSIIAVDALIKRGTKNG